MDRRQVFALLVLNELGIAPKLDTFNRRLTVQKALYLAQALGVDMGYFFGWYLHGPYCSTVARDLFSAVVDADEMARVRSEWTLDRTFKHRLAGLRNAVTLSSATPGAAQDESALARHLELLASVHFLVDRSGLPHHGTHKIVETLKRYRKDFTASDVRRAAATLKGLGVAAFA